MHGYRVFSFTRVAFRSELALLKPWVNPILTVTITSALARSYS
jgi:hypothetical protein